MKCSYCWSVAGRRGEDNGGGEVSGNEAAGIGRTCNSS